jgi:redox-sensitive bicupin YhaK (pirin superfamily)
VEHGDSLGNTGVISSGDVQWMTAGSGIIHQEMPKGDANGAMHGFQLWANLPAAQKMMAPATATSPPIRYRGRTGKRRHGQSDCRIARRCQGPMDDIVIDPEYFDCTVPAGQTFIHQTDPSYTAFIYVIGGKGTTDGQAIENGKLVLFDQGEQLAVSAAMTICDFCC